MFGLFKKFKEGLAKTTQALFSKVSSLFGGRKLDASSLDSLEQALYEADFGVETSTEVLEEIQAAYRKDKELRGQEAARIGAAVLKRVLQGAEGTIQLKGSGPTVICLLGVNGSGKTTTAAKLAHRFQEDGRTVLLAACDTFRAAANEQIKVWSDRLKVDLVSSQLGADAAAVAFDAWKAAANRGKDVLLIDTAGRLHTKAPLMEELSKIRRVLQKNDPTAPHVSLLVVDGSHGSNAIEQAKVFHQTFPLDGLIVTKLDGTSRGGSIAGIYRQLKLPIFYVGLGERAEDLQPFSAEDYANAVFGVETEEK
jgi:fused signal recognition particle receptor